MNNINSELKSVLSSWANQASNFVGDCFDYATPFFGESFIDMDPTVKFVSSQLFTDCALTSESIFILLGEGKEWDADILLRSILEGTFKFVYMLLGSRDEALSKAEEYWILLPKFADIKRSDRASYLLENISNSSDLEWEPLRVLVLDEERIKSIRDKYKKNQRKELEEKWSFSRISQLFKQSKNDELKVLGGLVYGYGMSSHLLHKDADGIGMVWERRNRDPFTKRVVTLGHAARIVSDVCTTAKLRLLFLLKHGGFEVEFIKEIEARYVVLFHELEQAYAAFIKAEYGER